MFSFAEKQKVDEDTAGKTSSTVKPKCETQKDVKAKEEDNVKPEDEAQNLPTTLQISELEETPPITVSFTVLQFSKFAFALKSNNTIVVSISGKIKFTKTFLKYFRYILSNY